MIDVNKYWIVHGGSDSYFAARNAIDAWDCVKEMNAIAMEYGSPPTSKVEVVGTSEADIAHHDECIEKRNSEGDADYFQP